MKRSFITAFLLITLATATVPLSTFAQPADPTWVYMVGHIEWFGDKGVGGWCGAWAKIDEWAEVHALWTWPQILPIPGNYTFYYARLVNASIIKLDYGGYYFYILGDWDVLKVTLVYDAEGNITPVYEILVDDAPGELFVTGTLGLWEDFTIAITGVELISGKVIFYRISSEGSIPVGDVKAREVDAPDGKIDLYDLVHVAHAYGDTPGVGLYNFDIDFNLDFRIDILDLTTVAANLGESY